MDPPAPIDPDDALAQPTRARLFALLTELRRPTETAELAERLELHPNGVRVHLERMERASLVARTHAPQARGRPRDAWAIARGARPGGAAPSAYGDLGRWLARALPASAADLDAIESTGREIGRELAPAEPAAEATETLRATLVALGFQPSVAFPDARHTTFSLGNCPYRDAVRENQPVVCALHRGMTRGLLDVVAPDRALVDFVPRDPDVAGCRIELSARGHAPRAPRSM